MFSLVHFCIKILQNYHKILIIIQRSNGDVLLTHRLISALHIYYQSSKIDLLVNDDTLSVTALLPYVNIVHTFSYTKKRDQHWRQEANLIQKIYRKYDLCINLTASDRSVIYALLASKNSISAIEKNNKKSWWKKIFLRHYYYFDTNKHILYNNLQPLKKLKIPRDEVGDFPIFNQHALDNVSIMLNKLDIEQFIVFHPSAQYDYKIYPKHLRDQLLNLLNTLGIPIIVTGADNKFDYEIKENLPVLSNVYNFIGRTTLEEYFALSYLSMAYIGMDTLNMHIAAVQNKRIFAIFGPTNLKMWAPWSNILNIAATENKSLQTYGNVTIFQSALPCVACGNSGCDNNGGRSECLYTINPQDIMREVVVWCENA